jgi:hypothetical protein
VVGTRISVVGNQISARGGSFVVAIVAAPVCDVSNNQTVRTASDSALGNAAAADIFVTARSLVVGGNRVVGPKGPSMSLHVAEGRYTVLGNITTGEILVPAAPLASPWAPLNVLAS